jgi:2-polyprenyl-6-methoxyphenol hydroxylase-like FAD-dependent oxidoreductase
MRALGVNLQLPMTPLISGEPSTSPGVLIVGAGPTGLVLALWLTHLGIKLRIVDKASEPGTTSRALGVQARTLEFYRQLGMADGVVADGIKTAGVNLWVKGSRVGRLPMGEIGEGQTAFPYILMYPQDVHEAFLIRKLQEAGVLVERPTELLRFEQKDAYVRATLRREDGTEETFDAAYLAGCDGASSAVRRAMTTEFPGGTYSHLFYVADVEASGPPTNNEVHVDMEEADFLAVFPLTRKGHVRVIGSIREDLAGERGTLTFDDVRSKPMQSLKLDITKENWFSTYRVHHRVAQHFREGRVFLLGDAAHLHSPVGAQGMNTGIGDSVNLSWKLASVLKGEAPESILDTYELERIAFARRLVSTTDRIFTLVTNQGALATLVRTKLLPILFPRIVANARFRRALFRTFSQIRIRYRNSPISSGVAGQVRGGDRLPWIRLGSGDDNFTTIEGLIWRVHVYGDLPAGIEQACGQLNLPLRHFTWTPAMHDAGLVSGGLYLLRPDSYVALAAAPCTPAQLHDYFRERSLSPGARFGSLSSESLSSSASINPLPST